MKRWTIKRKYQAFVGLDKLLRTNFESECTKAGLEGLSPDAGTREMQNIKEFLQDLTASDALLACAPVRQFLDIPTSRALFDLSNDSTRSIFSSTVSSLMKGKPLPASIPPNITLVDVIMVATVLITIFPLVFGIPFDAQPIAAGWATIICVWHVSQKEGIFDYVMEHLWGIHLVPVVRSMIRPADMPGFWMAVGCLVGMALGGQQKGFLYGLTVFLARIMVIAALGNLVFVTGVATNRIKLE